jgi:hypothetical protein
MPPLSSLPDYVICELRYDSRIAILPGPTFSAPAAAVPARDALTRVLDGFAIRHIAPLFGNVLKKKDLIRRRNESVAVPGMSAPDSIFALAGFVAIVPQHAKDCKKLVEGLRNTPGVWNAYIAPRPTPAGKKGRNSRTGAPAKSPAGSAAGSRNFEPAQGYLFDPPYGIGACAVWDRAGARGKGITICDIECAWNLDHEDLPAGIKLIGGEMDPALSWRNHGTAVLGELVSLRENVGCVGISHEARMVVHSIVINGFQNPPGAIVAAAAALKPGDIILIELQQNGPANIELAMQYWDADFAAIRTAVGLGIVVVEAAGNGSEDFDLPEYSGTGLQKDAGAIVVGAGVPPTNYFDTYDFKGQFPPYSRLGVPRSRLWASNYGQIVNMQGWGWHVTTLGYGDAQGGPDENSWYTHRFAGTSSASPIVAGAAACLQGFARKRIGRPLTPCEVRDILIATGTPQADDPPLAPLAQQIGPLPNLVAALAEVENRFCS